MLQAMQLHIYVTYILYIEKESKEQAEYAPVKSTSGPKHEAL